MLNTIRGLYDYNRWANRETLESTASLRPVDFHRDLGNSFRSIRDTLVHIMGAERIWLSRWQGDSPPSLMDASGFPTQADVESQWSEIDLELSSFIQSLTEDKLLRTVEYTNTKSEIISFPLWEMLLHVINHSSYHRGQIVTMLRQLGAVPKPTDLLIYYRQLQIQGSDANR